MMPTYGTLPPVAPHHLTDGGGGHSLIKIMPFYHSLGVRNLLCGFIAE